MPSLDVLVIVPLYNGGAVWRQSAAALHAAQRASQHRITLMAVDSSSIDDSAHIAREHGFVLRTIRPEEFDHGGTRNRAALEWRAAPADMVVFLTQDAILHDAQAIDTLLDVFADPSIAVAYGRQLAHDDANPIARHARSFNYGSQSHVAAMQDAPRLGIKTVFTSNAFAAYRLNVFAQLGGFPESTILSEDMYFAARAVQAGYSVAYVADAAVKHSHNYSPVEEFRRYFDIGVFHRDEAWIGQTFGGAGGEGRRFLTSEFRYMLKHAPLWIPRACIHNALKIAGYKLGKNYTRLPKAWPPRLSMHRRYWHGR